MKPLGSVILHLLVGGNVVIKRKLTTSCLIGSIAAVFLTVTEQTPFNTLSVTARQFPIGTYRFVGKQHGFDFTLFVLQFAILHGIPPIASLLLDVEIQTGRTTDGLQTLQQAF